MAIGKDISIFCNGVNLGTYLKSFNPTAEVEELDATVLANSYKSYESGFKMGMISAEGLFSADTVNADEIHDLFAAAYAAGTSNVVTGSFTTIAVGGPAILLDGPQLKYSVTVATGELVMVQGEFRATNGISFGYWLANLLIAAGITNGTTHDNAAATTNGGVFHVHLHNDDATDCDFKVQHSVDGSTWADLTGAAVNNLTATRTAGSATVATGTTVNRYTRLVSTVSGGDTTLVSAAFARR